MMTLHTWYNIIEYIIHPLHMTSRHPLPISSPNLKILWVESPAFIKPSCFSMLYHELNYTHCLLRKHFLFILWKHSLRSTFLFFPSENTVKDLCFVFKTIWSEIYRVTSFVDWSSEQFETLVNECFEILV